jgi:hypothetical protein
MAKPNPIDYIKTINEEVEKCLQIDDNSNFQSLNKHYDSSGLGKSKLTQSMFSSNISLSDFMKNYTGEVGEVEKFRKKIENMIENK